jgi:hypothetical protein
MTTEQLRAEAEWLATRSCFDRIDYLFEVEHCRGPEEAEALRREVERIKSLG